jgi:hypothetical protein
VESLLPYTENITTRQKLSPDEMLIMHQFIHNHIRHFFITSAMKNQNEINNQYGMDLQRPYYKSHASQGYFVVKAIK